MADRGAEAGAVLVPDGEEGDLVVEGDELLDDRLIRGATGPFHGVGPGLVDFAACPDHALPLAGGAHYRFHHAGKADCLDAGAKLLDGSGEAIVGGRELQLLGGQPPDPLPVHGEVGGPCRGDDGETFLFQLLEKDGVDRLDLRNDIVGALQPDHPR